MRRLDRLVERARRLPPLAVDGAIGAGIFALALLGRFPLPGLVPQALASIGVALRRKSLLAACLLVVSAHVGGLFVDSEFIALPVMALLYTVSEFRGLGISIVALIVSCLLPIAGWHHCCMALHPFDSVQEFTESIYPYLVLVWYAGRAQARRRHIASRLERGVAQLNEEREQLSRAAVDAERSRIARDLHSLLVLGVERMKAKTHEAREFLETDLGRASESVSAIESAGRATLVQMRRLLTVLRSHEGAPAPPPDVMTSELPDLAATDEDGGAQASSVTTGRSSPQWTFPHRVQRWIAIPWLADALLVLALTLLTAAEPLLAPVDLRPMAFLPLMPIALAVLLFRRRFPLPVLATTTVLLFMGNRLPGFHWTVERSMFVAVFTTAAFRGLWWGLAGVIARLIASIPWQGLRALRDPVLVRDLAFWTGVYLFTVAGGMAIRNARRLNAELRDQTELLRRTRQERIRLAVVEERTRVARDLHDVVAHALTVMVVQAGAARALAHNDPVRAGEALAAVEQTGREATSELDSLLGRLGLGGVDRAESLLEPEDRSVTSLVDHAIDAGLRVELVIDGAPAPLDAGLELAVYRIVQEALTNVRKHAPGARTWVEIRYSPDGVELEVTDTGAATVTSSLLVPGAGQGLVGIAERAALFGGEAEAGPTPAGGFRVRARLRTESVLV
jgi:signal transduction histidine kinase